MVLKLYSSRHPFATCAHRVMTVLREKGIPYEFVEVNTAKGENKTPEFLKMHPFGNIPVIDDDGFILYESRAICRYLAAKYPGQGPALIPNDPKGASRKLYYTLCPLNLFNSPEKAIFEQAASIEVDNFDKFASPAVFEKVFKKFHGQAPNPAVFEDKIKQLDAKLDVYDTILGKQKYLAGNEITLADIFHLPYGTMLGVAGSDIMSSKPNVSRWFKELQSRPSWQPFQVGYETASF